MCGSGLHAGLKAIVPLFQKPPLSDTHWPAVREYLLDQMQLPATVVDQAHDNGLLYSDNRRNVVFLREQDSGAFISSTKGRTFTRSLGHDDVPFALPGSDKAVYLIDTPMDALSLKPCTPTAPYWLLTRYRPRIR
jgi:hypothetical protein